MLPQHGRALTRTAVRKYRAAALGNDLAKLLDHFRADTRMRYRQMVKRDAVLFADAGDLCSARLPEVLVIRAIADDRNESALAQ